MTEARARHILLVTTSFPQTADGSEAAGAFVADFAAALSALVRVSVVAPAPEEGSKRLNGIDIHYFKAPRIPLSLLKPWSPADWPAIGHTLWAGAQVTDALVGKGGIDHIMALWALPSGYWARQAADGAGIRYSVWGLGSDIWTLGRVPLVRGMLRRVLRGAEHRFADGFQLAHDMQAMAGQPCEFLPSSRRFPSKQTRSVGLNPPFRLAFLGRWHRNKGIDLLVDGLQKLTDDDWGRVESVRIAGGGPLEAQVTAAVKALREAGMPVTQEGYLDRGAAAGLFDWTDFVVLPSRIESIPVVFSDAVQVGRPLICTPVGDLPRLMSQYGCGILAKGSEASDIAEALRRALRSGPGDLLAGLGEAAHDFDVRVTAKRVVGMLFGEVRSPDDD